jgi:hypothetical protein
MSKIFPDLFIGGNFSYFYFFSRGLYTLVLILATMADQMIQDNQAYMVLAILVIVLLMYYEKKVTNDLSLEDAKEGYYGNPYNKGLALTAGGIKSHDFDYRAGNIKAESDAVRNQELFSTNAEGPSFWGPTAYAKVHDQQHDEAGTGMKSEGMASKGYVERMTTAQIGKQTLNPY